MQFIYDFVFDAAVLPRHSTIKLWMEVVTLVNHVFNLGLLLDTFAMNNYHRFTNNTFFFLNIIYRSIRIINPFIILNKNKF
jgi:hypothetical protein